MLLEQNQSKMVHSDLKCVIFTISERAWPSVSSPGHTAYLVSSLIWASVVREAKFYFQQHPVLNLHREHRCGYCLSQKDLCALPGVHFWYSRHCIEHSVCTVGREGPHGTQLRGCDLSEQITCLFQVRLARPRYPRRCQDVMTSRHRTSQISWGQKGQETGHMGACCLADIWNV